MDTNYKPKLAIVIPTYNRSKILKSWLKRHEKILDEKNIKVCIIENRSTDATKKIIQEAEKHLNYLEVKYNEYHVNASENAINAILYDDCDYVWPIGDSYTFSEDLLILLIEEIQKAPDAIIINLNNRAKGALTEVVNKQNFYNVPKLSGIVSCLGTMIFRTDRIDRNITQCLNWSYFPQTLVFYQILNSNSKDANIIWIANQSLEVLPDALSRSNWADSPHALEIAAKNWIETMRATGLKFEIQSKLYGSLSEITNLFSLIGLLRMRAGSSLTYKNIHKYKNEIALVTNTPLSAIVIVSFLPQFIARYVLELLKNLRKVL